MQAVTLFPGCAIELSLLLLEKDLSPYFCPGVGLFPWCQKMMSPHFCTTVFVLMTQRSVVTLLLRSICQKTAVTPFPYLQRPGCHPISIALFWAMGCHPTSRVQAVTLLLQAYFCFPKNTLISLHLKQKWLKVLQQIPQAFDPDFVFIKIFEILLVWPQNVKTSADPFSSIA